MNKNQQRSLIGLVLVVLVVNAVVKSVPPEYILVGVMLTAFVSQFFKRSKSGSLILSNAGSVSGVSIFFGFIAALALASGLEYFTHTANHPGILFSIDTSSDFQSIAAFMGFVVVWCLCAAGIHVLIESTLEGSKKSGKRP